jgi:hypothetical protein
MFTPAPKKRTSPATIAASAAGHVLLLAALWTALHSAKTRPVYFQSRCCSTALYWSPSAANSGTPKPKRSAHRVPPAPAPTPVSQPVIAETPAESPHQAPTQSGLTSPQLLASLGLGSGSDDAEPALPLFHPKPSVTDRSLLPLKEHDVILNVNISSVGDVIDEQLVQGLGNDIDQIVLDTVKGWHFRPATLNGAAVASSQKVVVPISRDIITDPS